MIQPYITSYVVLHTHLIGIRYEETSHLVCKIVCQPLIRHNSKMTFKLYMNDLLTSTKQQHSLFIMITIHAPVTGECGKKAILPTAAAPQISFIVYYDYNSKHHYYVTGDSMAKKAIFLTVATVPVSFIVYYDYNPWMSTI